MKNLVDIESEAVTIRRDMAAVVIVDQPSYDDAVEKRTDAKAWLENANSFFDPPIANAHNLHKELLAQKRIVVDPVESALRQINQELVRFDQEQERKRREKQAEIDALARKQAEADRLELAEQLEAEGASKESIDSVLDAPLVVHAPVAESMYSRSKAVIVQNRWSAKITDFHAVVKHVAKNKSHLNLLVGVKFENGSFIASPAMNKLAQALKSSLTVPGLSAVEIKGISTGR